MLLLEIYRFAKDACVPGWLGPPVRYGATTALKKF